MCAAGAMILCSAWKFPCYIIPSYLAGDYFQALRNIIEPVALIYIYI